MPVKLNVGLARKVGEANYGSRGASINVEMEVDSSLIADPPKLQERIRGLFNFVRHAVDEELNPNGSQLEPPANQPEHRRLAGPGGGTNGNGKPNGSHAGSSGNGGRAATQSQTRAIFNMARYQKIDLAELLESRFHVRRVEELSLKQASELIDSLKSEKGR